MAPKDSAGDRVLSVREAVAFMDSEWHDGEAHLISESTVRRYVNRGDFPCTRTANGCMGVRESVLRAIFD